MTELRRIRFEPTLDERVEVTVRFFRDTAAGRAYRRRSLTKQIVVCGLVMLAIAAVIGEPTTLKALLGLLLLVTAVMALVALMFWQVEHAGLEDRVRRGVERHLATAGSGCTCEIELREEGVWARDAGVELTLPWSEAVRVEDGNGAVRLIFRSGIVVARGRAFQNMEEHASFVKRARDLAGFQEHAPSTDGRRIG